MKKYKIYLLLLVLLSFTLVGCADSAAKSSKQNGDDTSVAALNTDQNVMIFSTLSSASVLSQNMTTVSSLTDLKPIFKEDALVDMEKANSYLLMMETLLSNGGPIVVSEDDSDREGYDLMMLISVKDLAGNVSEYTIYYSVIVEGLSTAGYKHGKDNQDFESDNNRHQNNHDKVEEYFKNHKYGHDEEEIKYDIKALAIIDGVEYQVRGSKEVEIDDFEEEIEVEFTVKLDENNYVKIEQETENDEVEYQYTIYKNGKKFSSLSFEKEEENGATHIKISTTENGYKEIYKFIKGKDLTTIKYEGNGYSYTLFVTSNIDPETNEVVYEFKVKEKDFSWKLNKNNKHGK